MIKEWLINWLFSGVSVVLPNYDSRLAKLESQIKPKSIKDIRRNLTATMIDKDKSHTFTVHRVKGRFAKRPK